MGSRPGLVYQTFTALPVGVTDGSVYRATGGTCTGHKDKANFPIRYPYFPAILGHHYYDLCGPFCCYSRNTQEASFQAFSQGARRATHHWSMCSNVQGHSKESPGLNKDGVVAGCCSAGHILASITLLRVAHIAI